MESRRSVLLLHKLHRSESLRYMGQSRAQRVFAWIQLRPAAAATLIEAKENDAEVGLFLVHEFRSSSLKRDKLIQNGNDWENFVHAFPELAAAQFEKNQIFGPLSVPGDGRVPDDVQLYLGKLVTELP